MKWSQLKKRIEETFAESVAGRVEVWNTRYRKSHDQEGEAWITVDGQRVWSLGTYSYLVELYREAARRRQESGCTDFRDADQREGYYRAHCEAHSTVHDRGVFALWDVNRALFDYLNLSIDEAVKSGDPIIRAFATLDRRFGKRRLMEFDDSEEHPLVRTFSHFRCEAEGIKRKLGGSRRTPPAKERGMPDLAVRIVKLEPMTVASARAVGQSPEPEAWERLRAWAEPKGLLDDLAKHPVFGFNNPNPSPEAKEYGYEFWISVEPGEKSDGNIEIKQFPGGWYAVTSCRLTGEPNVLDTWKLLWEWVQSSEYRWRKTHELEKPKDPMAPEQELELELYLPIEEVGSEQNAT